MKTNSLALKVTNVSQPARSVTLEGDSDDLKYIVLVDYEIADMPDDIKVGDILEATFVPGKPAKKTAKAKAKSIKKSSMVPILCPGSAKAVIKANRKRYKGKLVAHCSDCSKVVSVNQTGKMRQHRV